MDADDIMLPTRIETQMAYMEANPDCKLCGAQIQMFREHEGRKKERVYVTQHRSRIRVGELEEENESWFMNHPTICFRKEAMLQLGEQWGFVYDPNPELKVVHDYEMLIRFLIKYGEIDNLPEVLLMYRLHDGQLTYQHDQHSAIMQKIKKKYLHRS